MNELSSEYGLIAAVVLVAGFAVGWLIRSMATKRLVRQLVDDWQEQVDRVTKVRDRLVNETSTLRTTIEAQEAVVHQRDIAVTKMATELESARENEKLLKKNIFTLHTEREDFKTKMATFQNRMASLQGQSLELQSEFMKSREFYKRQLALAFDKRKAIEEKLENSRHEYESFSNLLQASRSEHESVTKMLTAAKARLANLDVLEQSVIELEAENAQLKHDGAHARQEIDVLKRDLDETEELRVQNRELAQVLKSMENSRKQYEDDANRYREHASKTEKQSETLRVRLDEVEKNFLEIENQQREALQDARTPDSSTVAANDASSKEQEVDDLQDIIGIGKVFEHTLHELGIVSFRQIANFDVADIARVNAELKEFRGRMEQDDWIGQAKELHYKKHSTA